MNFKSLETAQKLRGGFYTEYPLASYLARWVGEINPRRILEPSCGDGVFLRAIDAETKNANAIACEIHPDEARKAQEASPKSTILNVDFLEWYINNHKTERFDAVVGNPPFIRYQYLEKHSQLLAEKISLKHGLKFTKHTNAWAPFVLASIDLLSPGGRLGMVIPSEILHIPHSQGVRDFLRKECSSVLLIDPQELWFDALQGTVLILAEKKRTNCASQIGVAQVSSRNFLDRPFQEIRDATAFSNGESLDGKWMKLLLRPHENELLSELSRHGAIRPFIDYADVDVGIVTGANDFFLVDEETKKLYELDKWAHPMFGRSSHLKGLILTKSDVNINRNEGLPVNFIWFQEDGTKIHPKALDYIAQGEAQKLHKRYKCSMRDPWYLVPSVYSAPIGMLKRAHNFPRLVLNTAKAFSTDTAYRIQPHANVNPKSLVFSFINSLTLLSVELEGRHYGGGVMELVPSEIERVLIPNFEATSTQLSEADRRFRTMGDSDEFVTEQDAIILNGIGLPLNQIETLSDAWRRIKNRRLRQD